MHHLRNLALAAVFVATAALSAAAEPGFVQLDRQDGTSRFGGDIAFLDPDDGIDATVLRFDLHGQYMLPAGFGFYGAFPITYASGDGGSGTGISDLEVGGIFLPHMANPNFQLVLHGGLTLPIGSDSLDDVVANALGLEARPTDLVQIIPQGMTLRAAASGILRSGQIFFRFDGGLDINLAQSGDGTTDPIIRINGGVGFDGGSFSVSGELINLISTDGDANDQMVNALAIGFRAVTGNLRPYGSFVVGPDDDDFGTSFAILGGIEATIGASAAQ
jgi:hypothetical protein